MRELNKKPPFYLGNDVGLNEIFFFWRERKMKIFEFGKRVFSWEETESVFFLDI